MKIKRNKKSYKWFLCGLILVVVLTISYRVSKANYRISNNIELTTGKVVSSPYDFNIVSIYIDGVEQSKDTIMPGKGYVLTSDSYCYKDNKNNKDSNVILETNKYGEHIIGELSRSSKCVLYFERKEGIDTASKYILSKISEVTHRKRGTFNIPLEETTTGKIYADSDDDGVTYYYAGNPQDNWVLFGGYYWRIIRINGDSTIRMIYQGKESDGPQTTGEGTQIGYSKFNDYPIVDNKYVGYFYEQDVVHGIKEPSMLYTYLNNWFKNESGLTNSEYFDKIDRNAGFCGDRQPSTSNIEINGSGGTGAKVTYYGAYIRLFPGGTTNTHLEEKPIAPISINPTFKCHNDYDLYTYISASKGNKALENPVGMITADEVNYAGMSMWDYKLYSINNYLNIGADYWTITPASYDERGTSPINSRIFYIWNDGAMAITYSNLSIGIRPVINLRSDVNLIGNGTISNPFRII